MDNLPSVYEYGGEPVTTSRAIAEQFGKEHRNVTQSIESIIAELNGGVLKNQQTPTDNGGVLNSEPTSAINREFAARNFFLTEYTDTQGKRQKQYILTRDGFTLLAMGFTGAKAMQFKVAYINAFNRMEQLIKGTGAGMLESARRAATQLEEVEDIAGAGRSTAADEVTAQTLGALRAALESGAVTLRRKHTDKGDDKCIGSYDHFTASVYSRELYKVYAGSLTHPLPYLTWHIILRESKSLVFTSHGVSDRGCRAKTVIKLSDIPYNPEKRG